MASIKYILSKIALGIKCYNAEKAPSLVPSVEARLGKTIKVGSYVDPSSSDPGISTSSLDINWRCQAV